jgi:hypothetical protein
MIILSVGIAWSFNLAQCFVFKIPFSEYWLFLFRVLYYILYDQVLKLGTSFGIYKTSYQILMPFLVRGLISQRRSQLLKMRTFAVKTKLW